MPNCYRNRLTVLHDSPKRVEEVMTAIRSEEREVIDFNRIIPMPEPLRDKDHDVLGEYEAKRLIEQAFPGTLCEYDRRQALRQHANLKPEVRELAEAEGRQMLRNIAKYEYPNWYSFHLDKWGTKWNSYGANVRKGDSLEYETANGYPKPVVEELSRKWPDVEFDLTAADEDIGSYTIKGTFKNGVFDGVEEHRTPKAFDIAFEMFPECKEEYRQEEDGTWSYNDEE